MHFLKAVLGATITWYIACGFVILVHPDLWKDLLKEPWFIKTVMACAGTVGGIIFYISDEKKRGG